MLFTLPFINPDRVPKFLRKIASLFTPIVQFFLLLVHSLLYLRLPQYSPKVLITTILLYLLESYSCSTRRYLSHAMNAPNEVESYLERIRTVEPKVTWKVRCFHYEEREFLKSWKGLGKFWENWLSKSDGETGGGGSMGNGAEPKGTAVNTKTSPSLSSEAFVESPPPWMAKKVVTHQAVGTYKFGR